MSQFDIKAARERQNQLVSEARQRIAEAEAEGVTDERKAECYQAFDRAHAEVDNLEEKINRWQTQLDSEARMKDFVTAAPDRHKAEHDIEQAEDRAKMTAEQAFQRYVQFGYNGVPEEFRDLLKLAGSNDLPEEVRAQAVGTDSAGGYLVPEGFQPEIVKPLAIWGPLLDENITRVVRTSTGNKLPWPTITEAELEKYSGGTDTDAANAGLRAENAEAQELDVVFGEKDLGAYVYDSGLVKVSREMLQDSAFEMGPLLGDLFGERIGRAANYALTNGSGSSQPSGLVSLATNSGVSVAAGADALDFDDFLTLFHSVDPAYRQSPKCRWMFNDSTMLSIRKIKDADGNYIWQNANAQTGEPANIFGTQFEINQAMDNMTTTADRPVVYGDLSKYVVREVMDMEIMRLAERYAEFRQVAFYAFMRFDGLTMDSRAIKAIVMG